VLCITANSAARLPVWVKSRKPQSEHIFSGQPQEADIIGRAALASPISGNVTPREIIATVFDR
jgi:hypothetical protein